MNAVVKTSSASPKPSFKPPKNWREVTSADGDPLYFERLCGRYWVRFECAEWWAYYSAFAEGFGTGVAIGKFEKPSSALIACREHMYEHGLDCFVPTLSKPFKSLI